MANCCTGRPLQHGLWDHGPLGADGGIHIRAGPPPSLQEQQGPLRCADRCNVYHQPIPYSTDIHHGSHERYKEMVKRVQTPRSPSQLYIMPLTDSQQYGWMMSKSPAPWTQVKRFPRKNSEMTKFVKEMSVTDREFSLF
ncbi:sperm microtubule inner protein 11 isoform X2 [Trachinotus anak]|uniref:sperm microtubule inner protein 11 isoform X2 n=1 Tax=Trachinotus anak TaxID=443729 RepID=UPI0039F20146